MKKWIKFFFLSFFSNEQAKEGIRRGYTNAFLSLILALVYLCIGVIGADTLPFGAHYNNATEFKSMVRSAFIYPDGVNGVDAWIEDGKFTVAKNENFESALIVDTFRNEEDRQNYAKGEYQLVIDTRPADAFAEVEAYCVSLGEDKMEISYEDYLTLNEVARKNFEFKLRYTGEEFLLTEKTIAQFETFLEESDSARDSAKELLDKYKNEELTKKEYYKAVYELYFKTYYPSIADYESNSNVPLLRNYYFHELIGKGEKRFLMVFDDCMVGSFATDGGIEVFFYGFYSSIPNGQLIEGYFDLSNRINAVDNLVKRSFNGTTSLSTYIYIMNTIRLIPVIVLMVIVVTMLTHSILSLKGVETCKTFGSTIKVIGSFLWFSGIVTALLTIIIAFMVQRSLVTVVSVVVFFLTILVRAIFFIISEVKKRKKEMEEYNRENLENPDVAEGQ